MNSLIVFTPSDGTTAIAIGWSPIRPSMAKSLARSTGHLVLPSGTTVKADETGMYSVWPSGLAAAAACAAMMPPPPGRLSTSTCCFHRCVRRSARMRAMTSGPAPGATDTTIVTGRSGYFACAGTAALKQMSSERVASNLIFIPYDIAFSGPGGRHWNSVVRP